MAKPPKHMPLASQLCPCAGAYRSASGACSVLLGQHFLAAPVSVLLWLSCLSSKEPARLKLAWSYLY